jgi:hypothetical protein
VQHAYLHSPTSRLFAVSHTSLSKKAYSMVLLEKFITIMR